MASLPLVPLSSTPVGPTLARRRYAVRVNEAASRFSLRDDNPQLLLAIENGAGPVQRQIIREDNGFAS